MTSQSSNDPSVYQQCVDNWEDGRAETLLQCVADSLEQRQPSGGTNIAQLGEEYLFILSGALVFFMQVGFAMLCAGCVRKKNAQNTMLKNLLDACGASLAFFCVGYAFAFGGQNDSSATTFIGSTNFFNIGLEDDQLGFWFFQYTFAAASVTIVAGTLAERCQMTAYLCYSMFLTGFVYPVVAHAVWSNNGFLSAANAEPFAGTGMIDFAGSGVVHLTGGVTALFATFILGSRRGRFFDVHSGRPLEIPAKFKGHSISLQLLGTMCLWFGWYGFNSGSALFIGNERYKGDVAARAAVNTSLSAAAGGIAALFMQLYLEERRTGEYNFDLQYAMNGCLSGLVAITAGCGTTENWASFVIGIVSGMVYIGSSKLLIKYRIDDAVDAIPVHMFNGIWGVVAVGLFSSPGPTLKAYGTDVHVGFFYHLGNGSFDANLLGCQMLGILFITGWTALLMVPFFLWLNYMGFFRTESVEELVGLDMSYHGRSLDDLEEHEQEEMKDEYLDAFENYKNKLRKRRNSKELVSRNSEQSSSLARESASLVQESET